MKIQQILRESNFVAVKRNSFHSGKPFCMSQGVSKSELSSEELASKCLDRKWALSSPKTPIHQITLSSVDRNKDGNYGGISFSNNTQPRLGDHLMKERTHPSFYILRDDLLHPLVNGNKARKLDALLPLLEDHSVTDLVTCGGCQSAHAAAVGGSRLASVAYDVFYSVSCAERGLKSHLLLRGEPPDVLTGYNLISTLYGNVSYIPRSVYAQREEMLRSHAVLVAGENGCVLWCNDIVEASLTTQTFGVLSLAEGDGSPKLKNFPRKVLIVSEGAGDVVALLGIFRLVRYLHEDHLFGRKKRLKFIVDAGTGTTAIGLGLAAACFGLPWEIDAVMLADTIENYRKHEKCLISKFRRLFHPWLVNHKISEEDINLVRWIQRENPRKFGNVLAGEIEQCQDIARSTGILLDPVYTLAAWELATRLSLEEEGEDAAKVVMLHTGGTFGMFGLAQRYSKSYFHNLIRRSP